MILSNKIRIRAILLLAALLVFAARGTSAEIKIEWKRLTSKERGFSITLPREIPKPIHQEGSLSQLSGIVRLSSYRNGSEYLFKCMPSFAERSETPEQMFAREQKKDTAWFHGSVLSTHSLTVQGNPASEYRLQHHPVTSDGTVEDAKPMRTNVVRLVAVRNSLFVLCVDSQSPAADRENVTKFFESFKLSPNSGVHR